MTIARQAAKGKRTIKPKEIDVTGKQVFAPGTQQKGKHFNFRSVQEGGKGLYVEDK